MFEVDPGDEDVENYPAAPYPSALQLVTGWSPGVLHPGSRLAEG